MGPDPEKLHNNNFEQHPSEFILNQMDDDLEMEVDEQQQNNGYFRLNLDNGNEYIPANDEETTDDEESADEEENEFAIPENMQQENSAPPNVPEIVSASSELIASVWNQKPSSSCSNIEITSEKSQEITQIMSKINLPNAPQWLDELSKESVLDRIKRKTTESDKN